MALGFFVFNKPSLLERSENKKSPTERSEHDFLLQLPQIWIDEVNPPLSA
jgi:hypothetical protein